MDVAKLASVFGLVIVGAVATADKGRESSKQDSEECPLEGTWKARPHKDRPGFIGLVFKGKECHMHHAVLPLGALAYFRIDANQESKQIDMWLAPVAGNPRPPVSKGIYKIEGDVLTIVFAKKRKKRPDAFDSDDVWVLQRADHLRK